MPRQKADNSSSLTAAIVILALIIASGLSYHEYLLSKNIRFHNYNFTANTIRPYCQYGYVCGMLSSGCAKPGAVYNCPMIPTNQTVNATVAVDLQQELNNSAQEGFTLNQAEFYSNSSSVCSRQLISYCNNNVPAQFICVNQKYSALVESQYSQSHKTPQACAMFILEGNISCGIEANYCVVTRSQTSSYP